MGRPSNPRLMARVLEAIGHLGEGKGSSARQVLELVRQESIAPTRNLAMQVHRALKNAVTAGLLQLRSGRYKMLIALKTAVNNRGENVNKTGGKSSAAKKREALENATDSACPQPLEAGPKSRCSHCKKHKRRSSRRRRKRSSKRRRRPTKQAKERNSRKLRRQGDEEVSNRRERRKKMPSPGARSQSEVPDGKRSERKIKRKDNDQDCDTQESARRNRSSSPSDTEGEDEAPATTKAKLSPRGRKNDSSSPRRRTSSRRRSSRKRNSSQQGTRPNDQAAENDSGETRMECCDDAADQGQDPVDEDHAGSRTSL